jgi:hypothetical protein
MRRFAKLISRDDLTVSLGKAFYVGSLDRIIQTVLRPNASVISTLAQLNHPFSKALQSGANTVTSNIWVTKNESGDEAVIPNYQNNSDLLNAFNQTIPRLDIGITRMDIVATNTGPIANFEHEGLRYPIPSALESHGTRQFFRIFPYLDYALRNGGIAIVDELDSSIHPMLLPEIIRWFHDAKRNPHHAQLWMTCHTTALLEDLLKQEIFFCEKDSLGRTSIYGLKDIEGVRNVDNFHRKYLGGVYGAVPTVA